MQLVKRKRNKEEFWLWAYADLITNLLIFFVALASVADINQVKMQQIAEKLSGKRESHSLSAIQEKLNEHIKSLGYQEVVHTNLTLDGLELSFDSGVMFRSGEAEIHPEWGEILSKIVHGLVPYSSHYRFAVEGHTDTKPIAPGSKFDSNWDLSAARANKVRSRLELTGIPPAKMRTEAYADTKGLDSKQTTGLSQEQIEARLRRVVIRVY